MDERNYDDSGVRYEDTGAHHERGHAGNRAERALEDPRNRQLLILIGGLILATLLALAIWQNSGTRGAKRDFSSARERVIEKEKEVADARRLLDQRVAELRAVSAEADVEATKLGGAVEQNIGGAIDEARVDAPAATGATAGTGRANEAGASQVYYVRDEQGRFVPVGRP